eukprot:754082-Pelagomonas_calceolata.AAC.1
MQPPLRPPASLRGAPGQRLMAFEAQGQDTPPPSQHNTTAKQIGRGNPFSIVAMPSPAIASSAPTPQCCVAAYTAWFTWFIIYFHFNGAMPSPAITSDASQWQAKSHSHVFTPVLDSLGAMPSPAITSGAAQCMNAASFFCMSGSFTGKECAPPPLTPLAPLVLLRPLVGADNEAAAAVAEAESGWAAAAVAAASTSVPSSTSWLRSSGAWQA